MKSIPLIVMWIVALVKGFQFFLVLFLFRPKSFPIVVLLVFLAWIMLHISLYLFIEKSPRYALTIAYFAVAMYVAVIFIGAGLSGVGLSAFGETFFSALPYLAFLIAAQFAFRNFQTRSTH